MTSPVRLRRPPRGAPRAGVLLLHGLAGGPQVWDDYAARADPDLELWEATLPWGDTAGIRWGPGADPPATVAGALATYEAAAGRGPDVVVAHSFTATTLLRLLEGDATVRPPAVVLAAPFYRPTTASFDWSTIAYYLDDFHLLLEEGIRNRDRGRLDPETRRALALRLRDVVGPYGWTRFFESYLATPGLVLARVTPPVFVVAGERDFAAAPDDSRALVAGLPAGHLRMLADVGHFAMVEHPARFAEIVDEAVGAAVDDSLIAHRTQE